MDPAVVCSADSMQKHPADVYRFYNALWEHYSQAFPNKAHYALAKLQKWARGKAGLQLITQNIDSLLESAGAEGVVHMHGQLCEARCTVSGKVVPFDGRYSLQKACKCCFPGHLLRPNVVFFGEVPFSLDAIYEQVKHCNVFCAVGTSGAVMPAGGLARMAADCGCEHLIEINTEAPANMADFNVHLRGKATDLVPVVAKAIRRYVKGDEKAFDQIDTGPAVEANPDDEWF